MLPAVIVAMTMLIDEDWRHQLRRNWLVFAAFAVVGLATVIQARYAIGSAYETDAVDMMEGIPSQYAYPFSVLTQSWLFFKYGLLWLLPNPNWMSVDMREPFAHGFFTLYSVALLAYLLYGFIAFKLLLKRGQRGLIGFALLFPWLMFATELVTVRFQEIFVLYRSYIWAMGGVMLLPLLLMQLNARLTVAVSVLIAATFFMVSMERLQSFAHPLVLWADAEKQVRDRQSLPGVGRIYYNLGTELLVANQLDGALSVLQIATKLSPKLSAAFGNLGIAYTRNGQNELAIQALSRAIVLDQQRNASPDFRYYYSRAAAYEASGQQMKAAVDYKVVCLLANKGCDKAGMSLKP
jgi:tetratricopeptide (TPR) repeat protein